MLPSFGKSVLAAALAATTFTLASPAMAHDRGRHRDNDDAAIAIGAGLVGLAVGAAIASDRDDDRYYRDRHYYDRPYRGEYYYRSYPRRDYYYDRYPRRDHWRHEYRENHGWRGRDGWRDRRWGY